MVMQSPTTRRRELRKPKLYNNVHCVGTDFHALIDYYTQRYDKSLDKHGVEDEEHAKRRSARLEPYTDLFRSKGRDYNFKSRCIVYDVPINAYERGTVYNVDSRIPEVHFVMPDYKDGRVYLPMDSLYLIASHYSTRNVNEYCRAIARIRDFIERHYHPRGLNKIQALYVGNLKQDHRLEPHVTTVMHTIVDLIAYYAGTAGVSTACMNTLLYAFVTRAIQSLLVLDEQVPEWYMEFEFSLWRTFTTVQRKNLQEEKVMADLLTDYIGRRISYERALKSHAARLHTAA